jgi:hypothetical protein
LQQWFTINWNCTLITNYFITVSFQGIVKVFVLYSGFLKPIHATLVANWNCRLEWTNSTKIRKISLLITGNEMQTSE